MQEPDEEKQEREDGEQHSKSHDGLSVREVTAAVARVARLRLGHLLLGDAKVQARFRVQLQAACAVVRRRTAQDGAVGAEV